MPESVPPILKLPNELIHEVVSYLNWKDALNVEWACVGFWHVCRNNPVLWQSVEKADLREQLMLNGTDCSDWDRICHTQLDVDTKVQQVLDSRDMLDSSQRLEIISYGVQARRVLSTAVHNNAQILLIYIKHQRNLQLIQPLLQSLETGESVDMTDYFNGMDGFSLNDPYDSNIAATCWPVTNRIKRICSRLEPYFHTQSLEARVRLAMRAIEMTDVLSMRRMAEHAGTEYGEAVLRIFRRSAVNLMAHLFTDALYIQILRSLGLAAELNVADNHSPRSAMYIRVSDYEHVLYLRSNSNEIYHPNPAPQLVDFRAFSGNFSSHDVLTQIRVGKELACIIMFMLLCSKGYTPRLLIEYIKNTVTPYLPLEKQIMLDWLKNRGEDIEL